MSKKRNIIGIFSLCIVLFGGNCLIVSATKDAKMAEQDYIAEYTEFTDIPACIRSESGVVLYLTTIERIDGIYRTVYQDESAVQGSDDSSAAPCVIVTVEKEIVNTYSKYEDIPEHVSYQEYHDDFETWINGTLDLEKAELKGSHWWATYKGTLFGNK